MDRIPEQIEYDCAVGRAVDDDTEVNLAATLDVKDAIRILSRDSSGIVAISRTASPHPGPGQMSHSAQTPPQSGAVSTAHRVSSDLEVGCVVGDLTPSA